jgi:glycerol-3-phosphate O-acyltransferase/dihydroxyacetone phosphate acyltransferase
VGLVYRDKARFRSRVAVWTGAPIHVAALRAAYERDPRAAVGALTDDIADGLRGVTLELEHWEDLPLLELAERILFSERPGRLERQQRFAQALRELRTREPGRVEDLARRITAFGERLARLGLEAHDLPQRLEIPYHALAVARFTLRSLAVLVLGLPLAVAGTVLWWLPYRLSGWLPQRFSTPDTLATGRILAGFLLFPLWWLGLVAVAWLGLGGAAALALAFVAPVLGGIALAFRDWRITALDEVQLFVRLASRRRLRERLLAERARLAQELEALRARLRA